MKDERDRGGTHEGRETQSQGRYLDRMAKMSPDFKIKQDVARTKTDLPLHWLVLTKQWQHEIIKPIQDIQLLNSQQTIKNTEESQSYC